MPCIASIVQSAMIMNTKWMEMSTEVAVIVLPSKTRGVSGREDRRPPKRPVYPKHGQPLGLGIETLAAVATDFRQAT